jgi:hypothetical protein
MKNTVRFLLASGLLSAALQLSAQQGPPAVLRIAREDIKEGKEAAHEKSEYAYMQAAAKAKFPAQIYGLTSMSGTSQAWFLEGFASFAAIEESEAVFDKAPELGTLDAADAELRSSSRSFIAIYRGDLSYGVDKINLPKCRYFTINTIRLRGGQEQEFTDLAKMVIAALEKAGDSQGVATYQVISGAPNGTFMLFEPTESLKSMDSAPQRQMAMAQALGDSGQKRLAKATADTIANEESVLFRIDPKMSLVAPEFAAQDPDFWSPKPTKAVTKAPAKAGEKTAVK